MNKQGSIMDIFIFMIMAMTLLIMLGIILFSSNIIKNVLEESNASVSSEETVSSISKQTVSKVVDGMGAAKAGSFILIFGMVLAIFLSNFFVRVHPGFFFIYLFVAVLGVVVAVPLSNFYETFIQDVTLGPTFQEFTATNFVILNLPIWVAVIGIFGTIFLLISMNRLDEGFGGPV